MALCPILVRLSRQRAESLHEGHLPRIRALEQVLCVLGDFRVDIFAQYAQLQHYWYHFLQIRTLPFYNLAAQVAEVDRYLQHCGDVFVSRPLNHLGVVGEDAWGKRACAAVLRCPPLIQIHTGLSIWRALAAPGPWKEDQVLEEHGTAPKAMRELSDAQQSAVVSSKCHTRLAFFMHGSPGTPNSAFRRAMARNALARLRATKTVSFLPAQVTIFCPSCSVSPTLRCSLNHRASGWSLFYRLPSRNPLHSPISLLELSLMRIGGAISGGRCLETLSITRYEGLPSRHPSVR